MKFLPRRTSGITLHAVLPHPASKQYRTIETRMQALPPHPQESLPVQTLAGSGFRVQQVNNTLDARGKSVALSPSAGFPGDC